MKNMKSLTFFGLTMVLLAVLTGIFAAVMQAPLGLVVMAAIAAALVFARPGLRRLGLLLSPYGAVSSGGDAMHRLYTTKLTHTAAVAAGDIVVIGGNAVEACDDYAANAEGVYIFLGKRIWPKEAALAIAVRDKVFWDATNNVVTKTAAGNVPLGYCSEAAAAADTTVTFMLQPNVPPAIQGLGFTTVTNKTTAGDVTYTAAEILGGMITRDPTGAARADLFPTAANIVAAIPGCVVGSSFEVMVRNTADAAETITMTTNTGLTLSGTMTIAQSNSKKFLAVVTNVGAPAVTIYSLGTVVH